jgi:hypothetical protein
LLLISLSRPNESSFFLKLRLSVGQDNCTDFTSLKFVFTLLVKCGEWTDAEGTLVMLAFDAKGRKAFYQLYRDLPHFTRCKQCPHGYLDTVQTANGQMVVEEKSIPSSRHSNEREK